MRAICLCLIALAGCAQLPKGVEASPAELKACAAEGCTVWTPGELGQLLEEVLKQLRSKTI